MTPMSLKNSLVLTQMFRDGMLVCVKAFRTEIHDDAGRGMYVIWENVQLPDTGRDVYRVMAFGDVQHIIDEWYESREESLQRYDETVMVHRENSLGDNAHS